MALDVRWIHGTPRGDPADPPIQVHAVDDDTYILRQSKDVNFEAPFLFLFCGRDRALLMDTGAVADPAVCPVRETVDSLLRDRGASYELVVAHTHGHGDHVAGDPQFSDRPLTTVVAPEAEAVRAFFGFTEWPRQVVTFDVGGRELEITGCPGHQAASIALYDAVTGFLLTGDTVLRGRLYAPDFPAFASSLAHLVQFAEARTVTHVLGCHIEMTRRPRRDYPLGCLFQPAEPPLEMTVAQLTAVRDAARSARPGVRRFDDFILYAGPCRAGQYRLLARARLSRLRPRWRRPW